MSTIHPVIVDAQAVVDLLGFTPEESLVVACVPVPPARDGLVARLDLADLHSRPAGLLERLTQPLQIAGARSVTITYFTRSNLRALTPIDRAVTSLLETLGIDRARTAVVDSPAQTPARSDLGVVPAAGPQRRQAVADALACTEHVTLRGYLQALEEARDGQEVSAELIAAVLSWLSEVHQRDAVVVLLAGGTAQQAQAMADQDSSHPATDVIDRLFAPHCHPGHEATVHSILLRQVVAAAPQEHQVPARTLLALIAWWQGHGALAARHLDHALRSEPHYRLALLLHAALIHAIPPGWARAPHPSGS